MAQRLFVDWVRYGDGRVYARAHVQSLDEGGAVLADLDPITLDWPEADVTALAVTNGRDEWGNDEIAQLLLENEITEGMTVGVPGVPAQPAIVNQATGEVIRPAVEAIPASVRAPGLRFEGISAVVWAGA